MAEKRGGANGGPQYNPMNVSATGGAGQSGTQAAQYIPGMRSQGVTSKEVYEQQTAPGVKMAGPSATPSPMQIQGSPFAGPMDLLGETTNPEEPISAGSDFGAGAGSDALPPDFRTDSRQVENLDVVKRYLPDLVRASRIPSAPDTYKAFVNYLIKQVYQ
jgi:hypothetical protein